MEGLEFVKSVVSFVLVFAFVVFLAYLSTKLVVSNNLKRFKSKNLELLEGIYLGQQKSLNLIRVANKAILISIAKDRIEKIETFNLEDLNFNSGNGDSSKFLFSNILNNCIHDSGRTNLCDEIKNVEKKIDNANVKATSCYISTQSADSLNEKIEQENVFKSDSYKVKEKVDLMDQHAYGRLITKKGTRVKSKR